MSVKDSLGYYNSPLPVGTVTAFAGVRIPIKWILCDGSTISKTDYPLLFDRIGYTYGGVGDNFSVPDLVTDNRAVYGAATSSNTPIAAGITGAPISIGADNLPTFNVPITANSFSASLPNSAWDDPQVLDTSYPTGLSVATGFNYATTYDATVTSKNITYTTTGSGGVPTPVVTSFSGVGLINFNNLEMTYIIKAEY